MLGGFSSGWILTDPGRGPRGQWGDLQAEGQVSFTQAMALMVTDETCCGLEPVKGSVRHMPAESVTMRTTANKGSCFLQTEE